MTKFSSRLVYNDKDLCDFCVVPNPNADLCKSLVAGLEGDGGWKKKQVVSLDTVDDRMRFLYYHGGNRVLAIEQIYEMMVEGDSPW